MCLQPLTLPLHKEFEFLIVETEWFEYAKTHYNMSNVTYIWIETKNKVLTYIRKFSCRTSNI